MPQSWTRREMLKMGRNTLLAAGLLSLSPLIRYLASQEDAVVSPLIPFKGTLSEENVWRNIPLTRVWVRRVAGGYQATLATCTHLGCEVTYYPGRRQWQCPCHGSVYDEEGRPIQGPAPLPLARVAVEAVADGSLLVNTAHKLS